MTKPLKSFCGSKLDKLELNLGSTTYNRDIKDSELQCLHIKLRLAIHTLELRMIKWDGVNIGVPNI